MLNKLRFRYFIFRELFSQFSLGQQTTPQAYAAVILIVLK